MATSPQSSCNSIRDAPLSLSSLPTEILQRILELTLPRLAFATFKERYSTLKRLSLVNKRWSALAQREMERHVFFSSDEMLEVFLMDKGGEAHRLSRIRSVWFVKPDGCAFNLDQGLQDELMQRSRLSLLYFANTSAYLDVGKLRNSASTLQVMGLDNVIISPTSLDLLPCFHALQRLVLSWINPNIMIPALLSTLATSQLNALFILTSLDSSADLIQSTNDQLVRLGPRLTTLGLIEPILDATTWASFAILQTLVVSCPNAIRDLPTHCPPALRHLILRAQPGEPINFGALLSTLHHSTTLLKQLTLIQLPPAHLEPGATGFTLAELEADRAQVISLCSEYNIKAEELPLLDDPDWPGYMDALDSIWFVGL